MKEFRYILQPYSGMNSRKACPACGKEKTFALYIDTDTGQPVHCSVGRCNRESSCGYHQTPKQYFDENKILPDEPRHVAPRVITPQQKPTSYISFDILKASMNHTAYNQNNFVQFLQNLFGGEITSRLIARYFIGTSKHWPGSTVFWQVDTIGKIRTGKIMLYNAVSGKRVKQPYSHITWVHTALKSPDFGLKQCLFGEHLLIDTKKPVAIVESEKTAIIASVYFPQFIWLAVGSLTNLNAEKCSVLKGRRVVLFPDLNGFEKWSTKAKDLQSIANFKVDDLLEKYATKEERFQGLDLADYLIKFDYRKFKPEPIPIKPDPLPDPSPQVEVFHERIDQAEKQTDLNNEISELETFFNGLVLPACPVRLNKWTTITDCSLFVGSHLETIKRNKGNKTFLPYMNRLKEMKQLLLTL